MNNAIRSMLILVAVGIGCKHDDPSCDEAENNCLADESGTATTDGETEDQPMDPPGTQSACCFCEAPGDMPSGCEPWDPGDECDFTVFDECTLEGSQLVCVPECP